MLIFSSMMLSLRVETVKDATIVVEENLEEISVGDKKFNTERWQKVSNLYKNFIKACVLSVKQSEHQSSIK